MSQAEGNNVREAVFEKLINEHLPALRRVVFRIIGNSSDTDDVIQQAMLTAWERFDQCREHAKLPGWVCSIACNKAYDLLRKRSRETALFESGSTQAEPAKRTADKELLEEVEFAIKSLPDHLHAALNLTVFEGLGTRKAAAALGCKPATLYWRVHKARKLLSRKLKEALP